MPARWLLRSLCLLFALGSVMIQSGCWTSRSEGEALRRDITELQKALAVKIKKAQEDRDKLQQVMEQATALLTRNSADVGAQVERIQAKASALAGRQEEQQQRIEELAQKFDDAQATMDARLEKLAGGGNAPVPEDKDEIFTQGQSKLNAGDHPEARRLLRHFITRYPDDPRVAQAQLLLGDSYFAEQKFAPAIVEYKKIIEQYKQSAVVPDALAKIGDSFYQLKFCADAPLFFNQLLKKYPRHAQAAKAKKILGLIKKFRHNNNVCRP